MEMGERIRMMRKECGLTQGELAQKLGLKDSAVAKYENGRVENIKRSTIQKMADIFGCSPTYLLGIEEQNPAATDFTVTDFEKELLIAFRKADSIDKEMVLRVLGIREKREDVKIG